MTDTLLPDSQSFSLHSLQILMQRFTDLELALALAMVRSTPQGVRVQGRQTCPAVNGRSLNIVEHIASLRRHVALGSEELSVRPLHYHLSRASYWQSRHNTTAITLEKAQTENLELQQQIDDLRVQVNAAKPTKSRKRKPEIDTFEDSSAKATRRRKQIHTTSSPTLSITPRSMGILEEDTAVFGNVGAGE